MKINAGCNSSRVSLSKNPNPTSFSEKSLFAQRARVSCVRGAKRLKLKCFWGIHFPESILCERLSARTFLAENKFFAKLNRHGLSRGGLKNIQIYQAAMRLEP